MYLDVREEQEEAPQETPSKIAIEIRTWLSENRTVSVAVFAKEIVKRSQGTVSSLLNNPPPTFPTGAGREPWQSMKDFLKNEEEKKRLLDKVKERKGKHFTDFVLRHKKRRKQAISLPLLSEQGKANRHGKLKLNEQKARKLCRQKKRHGRSLIKPN